MKLIITLAAALTSGIAGAYNIDYAESAKSKANADCLLGRAAPGFLQPGQKLHEVCDTYYDKVVKPQGEDCLASLAHKLKDPESGRVLSFNGKELRFTATNSYGGRVNGRAMCSVGASGKMERDRSLELIEIRQESADHRSIGIYLSLDEATRKAGFLSFP